MASNSNLNSHAPETLAMFTVSGYVRRYEKQISKSNSNSNALFQHIPPLVTSVIISFYFVPTYFEIAGDLCAISEDTKMIEKVLSDRYNGWDNASYTTSVSSIMKKICKWDLKIHKAKRYSLLGCDGCWVSLGISSSAVTDKQFVVGVDGVRYGYAGWNGYKLCAKNTWTVKYGKPYKEGDVVSIELDCIKGVIIFYNNYESQGIAYKDIKQDDDTEYRVAISMYEDLSKIEITNYSERFE